MSYRCPRCMNPTKVYDSRPLREGRIVMRRRVCRQQHRFTTYEGILDRLHLRKLLNILRADIQSATGYYVKKLNSLQNKLIMDLSLGLDDEEEEEDET